MATKMYLNIDANAKTIKGQEFGYLTGLVYLAPSTLSGYNVCAFASRLCALECLNTAGMGVFSTVQKARIAKTKAYFADKKAFIATLAKNIVSLSKKAANKGLTPCVRLNGTSDLPWETSGLMQQFSGIQFYDYTKSPIRMRAFLAGKMPQNYHLTFSLSEDNMEIAKEILSKGGNVAMVFDTKKGKPLPTSYMGYRVIDGDKSDLRFLDDKNVIVGLRAKGKAKKDTGGFVQKVNENLKIAA